MRKQLFNFSVKPSLFLIGILLVANACSSSKQVTPSTSPTVISNTPMKDASDPNAGESNPQPDFKPLPPKYHRPHHPKNSHEAAYEIIRSENQITVLIDPEMKAPSSSTAPMNNEIPRVQVLAVPQNTQADQSTIQNFSALEAKLPSKGKFLLLTGPMFDCEVNRFCDVKGLFVQDGVQLSVLDLSTTKPKNFYSNFSSTQTAELNARLDGTDGRPAYGRNGVLTISKTGQVAIYPSMNFTQLNTLKIEQIASAFQTGPILYRNDQGINPAFQETKIEKKLIPRVSVCVTQKNRLRFTFTQHASLFDLAKMNESSSYKFGADEFNYDEGDRCTFAIMLDASPGIADGFIRTEAGKGISIWDEGNTEVAIDPAGTRRGTAIVLNLKK